MKSIFYLLTLTLLVSCSSKNEYTINGSFKGDQNEQWIYLTRVIDSNPQVDSARIENGQFHFSGTVEFPEVYALTYHRTRFKGAFPFFLEASNLEMIIDADEWVKGSSISGGPTNSEYNTLEKKRIEKYIKKIRALDKKQATATAEEKKNIDKRVNELWAKDSKEKLKYIRSHYESPISIYLLSRSFYSLPLEELKDILSNFSPNNQKTAIYQMISEFYQNQVALQKTTPALVNLAKIKTTDINLEGKPIIATLSKNNPNKVLYIDIWGTFCGPCIKEFPYSRELRTKIDTNKIELVYLCVNSKEEKWRNMIKSQKLKGQHFLLNEKLANVLSDEIGGIEGIPRYVIVNKDGKIVNNNAPCPSFKAIAKQLEKLSEKTLSD